MVHAPDDRSFFPPGRTPGEHWPQATAKCPACGPQTRFVTAITEDVRPSAICFTPRSPADADEWEQEPGVPVWALGVWLWVGNPDGVFGEREIGVP
jgi:hypothetical protein